MGSQFAEAQVLEVPLRERTPDLKELLDLQLSVVGGGCVEYCPY
jgi:hypothetical protein